MRLITFVIAYFIVIAPAGFFRAWVAKKMGDSTGEQLGFLTFNPLVHINGIGLFILVFSCLVDRVVPFGWGAFIPINPHNITGRLRPVKLFFAYFSDVLFNVFCAMVVLSVLLSTFGVMIMPVIFGMNPLVITQQFPEHNSLAVAFGFIGVALVLLQVMLVGIETILNLVMLLITLFVDEDTQMEYGPYLGLAVIPAIFLFGNLFVVITLRTVTYGAYYITAILGLL